MQSGTNQPRNQATDPVGTKWTGSDQGRENEKIYGKSGWKPRSAKQAGPGESAAGRGSKATTAGIRRAPTGTPETVEKPAKKTPKTGSGTATRESRRKPVVEISQGNEAKRKPAAAAKSMTTDASKPRGPSKGEGKKAFNATSPD